MAALREGSQPILAASGIEMLIQEWVRPVHSRHAHRTPLDTTCGSNIRVLWRCSDCGHEWEAAVFSRALNGSGCSTCKHAAYSRRFASRVNLSDSIAAKNPAL